MRMTRKHFSWHSLATFVLMVVVVCSMFIEAKAAELSLTGDLANYFTATYESTNGKPTQSGMSVTISAKANQNYGGIKSGCDTPAGYERATTIRLKAKADCVVNYTVTVGTAECTHANGSVVLKGTEISFTVASPTDAKDATASATIELSVINEDNVAPDDCASYYVKGNESNTYYYLDEAVNAARNASEKIVVLKTSGNVYTSTGSKTVEIPAGVTLLLPREPDELDIGSSTVTNKSGTAEVVLENANFSAWAWDSRWKISPGCNRYLMLTIPSDTTVKNSGSIILGGSIASNIAYFAGGTLSQEETANHRHSDLTVDGTLELESNSVLSAIGFVLGSGTVKTADGATGVKIYQAFVVNDYRGGNYVAGAAGGLHSAGESLTPGTKSGETAIAPFVRYSFENIRAKLIISGGNYMYGYADMWASDKHNMTVSMIIGGSTDDALIKLSSGAILTSTYSTVPIDHKDANDNTNWGYEYVGKITLIISGDASLGSLKLSIPFGSNYEQVAMSGVAFPLPYNYDVTLKNGTCSIPYSMIILPGAKLTVGNGSTLNIGDGVTAIRFMVMDGLYDHTLCGENYAYKVNNNSEYGVQNDYNYPTSSELINAGYSGTGSLVVDGGILNISSGVSFGGLVQTTGAEKSAVTFNGNSTCKIQVGLVGSKSYHWAGATVRELEAKIKLGNNADVVMTADSTYKGAKDDNNGITSYTYTLYTNTDGTNSTHTENVNFPVLGMWYDHTLTVKETGKNDVVYYHLNNKLYTADGEVTTHTITDGCEAAVTSGRGVEVTTSGSTLTFSNVALTEDTVVTVGQGCNHSKLTEHPEDSATCEKDGIKAYWTCDDCKLAFSDKDCTIEIANLEEWKADAGKISASGHTFGKAFDAKAATCQEAGNEAYKQCTVCNKYFAANAATNAVDGKDDAASFVIAQKTHSYTGAIKSDGNGKDATHSFKCVNGCNVYGAAVEHSWNEGAVTSEPKCEIKGVKTFTCTAEGCGATYTEEVEALEHAWTVEYSFAEDGKNCSATRICGNDAGHNVTVEAEITSAESKAPTCEGKGKTTYTATFDADWAATQTKEVEDVPALGHTPAEAVRENFVSATCSTDGGFDEVIYCDVCGEQLSSNHVTLPMMPTLHVDEDQNNICDVCENEIVHVHKYDQKNTGKDYLATSADCENAATYYYTCKCGAVGEETFVDGTALGHTAEKIPAVTASCTKTGLTEGSKCSVCGDILVKQEVVEKAAHTEEIIPGTPATCTKKGLTDGVKCSVCKAVLKAQEEISILKHTEVTDKAVPATCTSTGKTEGKHCSVCGTVLVAQKEVAKTAHTAVKISGKAATCTEKGLTDGSKCSVCGVELAAQKEIPAKGHSAVKVNGKPATCTEKGLTDGSKCSVCGTTLTAQKETPALGHSFSDGKCTICGAADPNYVPPTEPTEPEKPSEPTQPSEPSEPEQPTEPKPTEPEPTEPEPTEPEPTDPVIPEDGQVSRIAGASRYETSFAIANELKEVLGMNKFRNVILANSDVFADALAGSYLAAEKNAPILIGKPKYAQLVWDYVNSNLEEGGTVYVLGGVNAVPESMLDGITVTDNIIRLEGEDRYGTNLEILDYLPVGNRDILVATGRDFADSLSASATGLPILLVNGKAGKSLSAEQKDFLANVTGKIYILGGESAVPADLEAEINEASGQTATRISGAGRYETSVNIAKTFLPNAKSAVTAYASTFPDGLCGGPLAYAKGAPLLLTKDGKAEAPAYAESKNITSGYVLGGDSLISDAFAKDIFNVSEILK